MNTDKTIYGIIGSPLQHSLSPVMQNAAFKALEVDAIYQTFPLEPFELDEFFDQLRDPLCPIFGLNVTVPYKEKIMGYLDSLTPLAEKVQAVNTIVINKERKLIGFNTDAPGFMAHIKELDVDITEKNIAILGAGGSSRAILTALCIIPERPKFIRVYNRTEARIVDLIEDLKQRINLDNVETVNSVDDLDIPSTDILINTTSVGLKEEDPCLIDEDLLHGDLFVYDLIYNPKETPLLQMAKEKGARVSNGLGMLFFQGVLALEHWANMEIDERIKMQMRKALEEACY